MTSFMYVWCCAACIESPLSDRKLVNTADDATSRLGDIWRQARELKTETQLLRQAHVEHVSSTKQLLQATFVKIKVRIVTGRCFYSVCARYVGVASVKSLAGCLIYARALLEYVIYILWVRSFSKMLPYVKFAEDEVLVFVILRETC